MTKQSLINEHREFFPALHGLRGIAVLFVVFSHLGGLGLFLFPIPHDGIGKVGVWIFFVLSAFLLTKNLYQDIKITASSLSSTIKYVVHRIFRIYPLYIVVLILHVIRGHISIIGFIKHLALIQAWGELWAIPVEFQYYLLMPVIVIIALFLSKKHTGFLLLTATIASLLYGTTHSTDVFSNELNIIPKLVPFLLGSILSLQFYSNNNSSIPHQSQLIFFIPIISIISLIIATILFRGLNSGNIPTMYAPWISFAIGLSVIGVIYSTLIIPTFSKILGAKPLVFIGETSFSIYLVHVFIINIIQKIPNLTPIIRAWSSLALIILCAYVSYLIIEKPGIRIGKKVAQHFVNIKYRFRLHSTINDDEHS